MGRLGLTRVDSGEDGGEEEQGGQTGHRALLGFHDSGGKCFYLDLFPRK